MVHVLCKDLEVDKRPPLFRPDILLGTESPKIEKLLAEIEAWRKQDDVKPLLLELWQPRPASQELPVPAFTIATVQIQWIVRICEKIPRYMSMRRTVVCHHLNSRTLLYVFQGGRIIAALVDSHASLGSTLDIDFVFLLNVCLYFTHCRPSASVLSGRLSAKIARAMSSADTIDIAGNLEQVQDRVLQAAAGRNVRLVAVSKTNLWSGCKHLTTRAVRHLARTMYKNS